MKGLSCLKRMHALGLILVLALVLGATSAWAAPWSFGVMSDTQWTVPDDGKNPNTVSVGIIDQINAQFIKAGVEFVVQVGDLTDKGNQVATDIDTRAAAAQALYNAGIGFYPLRGNHEDSQAAALQFQMDFPQTRDNGVHVFGAYDFSSPSPNLYGLSYAFQYGNARFVLLDQFTRTDGQGSGSANVNNSNIADQQGWIGSVLADKLVDGHAFVFGHKNLIGENHVDVLLGANPGQNAAAQSTFISSLHANGVRYYISGHDHIHQRSIITSPDGSAAVQEIIGASDSSKFYIPAIPSNDNTYNNPPRETSVSQEVNTVGYYIYTVDGPRVTVDYYSAVVNPTLDSGEYLIYTTPTLQFTKRETFGYSLNGKEFLVAEGQPYTNIQDSFSGTTARILSGMNSSTAMDGSNRPLTKAVDTGWSARTRDTASNIFSLWGMASNLGSDQTDVYTLSMTNDPRKFPLVWFGRFAHFGLATKDANGHWINAVDKNFGGTKKLVFGPWQAGYKLGTYGIDQRTNTAWAVVNHAGDFALAWCLEGR